MTEVKLPAKPKGAPGAAGIAVAAPAIPVGGQAQLRVRPTVQGAALVLENKTGRILAMAGSFSYALSQLNRTSQTQRQPGSAMKPLTYLTALQAGLQPNTLVRGDPITLPPYRWQLCRENRAHEQDYSGLRETPAMVPAAFTRCDGAWRIRSTSSPLTCSTAVSVLTRRKASTKSARPRSPRKSTTIASAIIRLCSAPSRCA